MEIFNQIQIMTIQACNLKCDCCPNKYIPQSHNLMSTNIFSKIINELSSINYNQRITLYLMNEPFLDNRLKDFIIETRLKCKNARINISTNGIIPTYEDLQKLFDVGLSDCDISCYNQTTIDKWMKHKSEKINAMNMISPQQLNNRGGNIPEYGNNPVGVGNCNRPSIQMYINAWGEAVLCCSDYKRSVVLGNVIENTLLEIWNNDKYNAYRENLKTGNRTLPLCKDCNF